MRRLIFFSVLIIVIITLHLVGALSFFEKTAFKVAEPTTKVFGEFFNFFGEAYERIINYKNLEEENKRLREKVKELVVDKNEFNIMFEENNTLRNIILFSEETQKEIIAARVLGKVAEGDVDAIIINKGEKDGITLNLPVVAEEGILVGKVIKVSSFSSVVLLLSDGSSNIAGMIQNKTKTAGVVRGGYGLGIRLELIPQAEEIRADDIVVSSGVEVEMPKGLLIGTIESVIKEPNTPFQSAIVKPLLDFEKLDIVAVLK
jgi:rod shape-determining protein MreC